MGKYYHDRDVMRIGIVAEGLDSDTLDAIADIKAFGQAFWDKLDMMTNSADMTLAKRKVEEAVMWAVKAITA